MSEQDIIKLMQTGSIDEFLDCLDFAPPGVIDLIKKLSVSLPMTDFQKVNALKAKTGFDASAALKHDIESKEDNGENTILKTSERRVKKEEPAAAPARRTEAKYNIVSISNKKEEAAE